MSHLRPAAETRSASHRGWLVGLLALTLAVRGAVLWSGASRLRADPDSYRELALALQTEGTFGYPAGPADAARGRAVVPTAYRPPLYPLTLALAGYGSEVAPAAVATLHLLLGLATVGLVADCGRRWASGSAGWLAGLWVAVDPILLNQSVLVMTETLATLAAVVGLILLDRMQPESVRERRAHLLAAGLAGGGLAWAALCRPTFLVWLGLAWLACAWFSWRRGSQTPLVMLVAAVLALSPWALRNAAVLGRPVATTTHGGYTLWLANNDDYYRFLTTSPWGAVWDSRALDCRYSAARRDQGEIAADRWGRAQAWTTIRRQPGTFAYACLVRWGSLWGLVPHQVAADETVTGRWLRYAIGGWYLLVFVLALAGLWILGRRVWRPPWLWGLLLVIAFTAVHTCYWTNLRMRAPLMPVVYLWAAVAWEHLVGKYSSRLRFLSQKTASAET